MIVPTIGRVVWYYSSEHRSGEQPWPALICYVHDNRLINLGGFRADGTPFDARDVYLVQEEDEVTPPASYARRRRWMPYQQMVAKNVIPGAEANKPQQSSLKLLTPKE